MVLLPKSILLVANHKDWNSCDLVSVVLVEPQWSIGLVTWFLFVDHSLSTCRVHPVAWTSNLLQSPLVVVVVGRVNLFFFGGPVRLAGFSSSYQMGANRDCEYSSSEFSLTVHDTSKLWLRQGHWKLNPSLSPKAVSMHPVFSTVFSSTHPRAVLSGQILPSPPLHIVPLREDFLSILRSLLFSFPTSLSSFPISSKL